jgi:hypothetical protein
MSRFLRVIVGLGCIAGFAGGASAAGATTHSVRLIDTNRIIGFPQQVAAGKVDREGGIAAASKAPSITQQPQNETVPAGSAASFSAAASGSPTPTVQWSLSTNGGSRWSTIRGATSTTYTFTVTSSENGYEYRAVFRNRVGSATTNAATLTVGSSTPVAPNITSEPSSETVANGATASFSAAASGTPTPTVQWWQSSNGGAFSAIPGANSTTYSFTSTTSENGDQFYAVFTNSQGSAQTNTVALTVSASLVESSNWSGYADLNQTYDAVSASWKVPTVTCSGSSSSYSAEWIGIDGYSSNTVEQDGSEADCLSGSPSYDAWYEMYGDNAVNSGYEVELSPSSYPVSHGDAMNASVSVAGSTWTLSISDTTQGWNFSTQIGYSGAAESSAEWIVERPEICSFSCRLASLADFGTVTFTGSQASVGSNSSTISGNPDTAIEMVNGSTPLATPGSLDGAGDSFTDTWQAS